MLKAFIPGLKFPAISITGERCELLCSYCKGRWLKQMLHVSSPKELEKLMNRPPYNESIGLLVSGGFTKEGTLPFEPYLAALIRLKKRGLIIAMHSGFLPRDKAKLLEGIVDIIDYEIPITQTQLNNMNIKGRRISDYIENALMLKDLGFYVAPHFLLGLPGADSVEEMYNMQRALRMLRPEVAIILYYTDAIEKPMYIASRLREAAKLAKMYSVEVSLGCMRPHRMKRLIDPLVVDVFDRIAMPHRMIAVEFEKYPACCSLPLHILRHVSR